MLLFRKDPEAPGIGYNKVYAANPDVFPIPDTIMRAMDLVIPRLLERGKPAVIFECGCAQGNSLKYIGEVVRRHGFTVGEDVKIIGCDYSSVAIDQCIEKFPEMDFINTTFQTLMETDMGASLLGRIDLFVDIGGITNIVSEADAAHLYSYVKHMLKPDGMYYYQINRSFYNKWMLSRDPSLWQNDLVGAKEKIFGKAEQLDIPLGFPHEIITIVDHGSTSNLRSAALAVAPAPAAPAPQPVAVAAAPVAAPAPVVAPPAVAPVETADLAELTYTQASYAQPRYTASHFDQSVAPVIASAALVGTLADQAKADGILAGARAVFLRHDVDLCLRSALEMARFEAARGLRATYFLLHTADYFWNVDGVLSPQVRTLCSILNDHGHEVGLHNDALTVALLTGQSAAQVLGDALEALRSTGVPVIGSAAHGGALARKLRYANYEVFAGMVDRQFGHRDTLVFLNPKTGRYNEVDLGTVDMSALGLRYEAYALPRVGQMSDTGGNLRRPEEQYAVYLRDGGPYQILLHPEYWRMTGQV